ncbi:histidine kinase [Flavobacterium sp. Leaf82]|jgi:CheY-like chemotaxis protein|uniref:response regulator n=1 Tax=unclassified Flavobacterium TaxID=196869 RepID=UPI0006FDC264|nr:response regulator [Flavobacterium sp. Leaf82]KQO22994.1 histidine kinase [Flavobacterium sp. Leaf82]
MDKKIILLADDDMDDTEMFCEALEEINKNIVCHCADNGSEALRILDELQEKPELIFLDLNMPVMNGWDCLKFLKKDKRYEDIPVIMISTSSHRKDMDIASDLGAVCYFVKPNNFNDLKHVLHTITSNLGAGLREAVFNLQATNSDHIFACS